MKYIYVLTVSLVFATLSFATSITDKGQTSIVYSAGHYLEGQPITQGYDIFGYNYQAHMFSGSYFNAYAGAAGFAPWKGEDDQYLSNNPGAHLHWAWPYRDVDLTMKWNDSWTSNMDRDGDGSLDRHYGLPDYIGSSAWETNHMSGSYEGEVNGKWRKIHWTYFVKIVAVPSDAVLENGIWYEPDGTEIGESIWGQFAIIQEISNDPGTGDHGAIYVSPAGPGFGKF